MLVSALLCRRPLDAEERTWMLDIEFDRPQQVRMQALFEAEQAYWYMTYTVTNNTGADRDLLLKIWLVVNGDSEKRSYPDRLMPLLQKQVESTVGAKLNNRIEMIGKIKSGETRKGIALFGAIGFDIKTADIYIDGLSKRTLLQTSEGRPYYLARQVKAIYQRLGDVESDPYTVLVAKKRELSFVEEKIPESLLKD
jgi:hypothetical protein